MALSEQNLVDCAKDYGDRRGCTGGSMLHAYTYIMTHGGIDTEQSYPYEGRVSNREKWGTYVNKSLYFAESIVIINVIT